MQNEATLSRFGLANVVDTTRNAGGDVFEDVSVGLCRLRLITFGV